MKEKVISYLMTQIKKKNLYDEIKIEQIQYGLEGLYSIITKSIIIILLAFLLKIFDKLMLFCLFYIPLRSLGFGTHAKSNLKCWILSITFLLGLPYLFSFLKLKTIAKVIIWSICFINYFIFCPADTENRPMINKKRKHKFKLAILIVSLLYLFLVLKYNLVANSILSAMILESILVNPIGYILMGQKVRFHLNLNNLKGNRMEGNEC